jgi:uncharacterized protein
LDSLGNFLLIAGMLLGLAIIPFGLPGTLVILAVVLIYAVATHFAAGIGVAFFVMLCVLTFISETADNWLTALGARRFGASRASMWLSFVGGLAGAIVLGGPLALVLGPLGPVGGGFAGAFLAVFLYEYSQRKDTRQALRAGWGTLVGRLAGMVLKVVIAIGMIVAVAVSVFSAYF